MLFDFYFSSVIELLFNIYSMQKRCQYTLHGFAVKMIILIWIYMIQWCCQVLLRIIHDDSCFGLSKWDSCAENIKWYACPVFVIRKKSAELHMFRIFFEDMNGMPYSTCCNILDAIHHTSSIMYCRSKHTSPQQDSSICDLNWNKEDNCRIIQEFTKRTEVLLKKN